MHAMETQKPWDFILSWCQQVFYTIFLKKKLLAKEQCVLRCEKGWVFSGETSWSDNVRRYIDIRTSCDFGVFMKICCNSSITLNKE